jgi:hypothetical protein
MRGRSIFQTESKTSCAARQVAGSARGGEGKPCEFTEDCVSGLTCVAQSNSSLRVCRR